MRTRRTYIIPSQKIKITEDVEDDGITPPFFIILLELIFVQILDRHDSYFASNRFIVSYGYFLAEHVIINNCSFANVEVFIGILDSFAFANVFIDIPASISIAEGFNIILGNVIIAITESNFTI